MRFRQVLLAILPFWLFILAFKFGGGLHYSLLPAIGEQVFPIWMTGLLIGGASLLQMALDVPAGFMLDRYGYVRMLKIGTFLFFLGAIAYLFGLSKATYIISLVGGAAGWLFFGPGMDAYVLAVAPKAFAGRFIAMRDMMDSAGIVISMAIMPLIIHLPVPWLGLLAASGLLIAILLLYWTPKERSTVHDEKKVARQGYYIRRHFFRHIWHALKKLNPASTLLLLSGFSASVFYGTVWFVIPLLIAQAGRQGALDASLIVFDLSTLLIGFFIGRITDRWEKRTLVFWGLLLFAVMALLLGFHFGILFLVFGFLATIGDELAGVSLWAWMDHLDKDHAEDGLVSSAISLAHDLGWTIGPILAGFLFQFVGPSWTIAIGSSFIFITWLASFLLTHHLPDLRRLSPEAWFHAPRVPKHKR